MGVKGAHIPLGGHIHDEKNLALECAQFNIIAINILQPSHTSTPVVNTYIASTGMANAYKKKKKKKKRVVAEVRVAGNCFPSYCFLFTDWSCLWHRMTL
jgi:purine-cytosine permease-like protein